MGRTSLTAKGNQARSAVSYPRVSIGGVVDPVALWGAITGTAVIISGRRELHGSRTRVGIDHRLFFILNRDKPGTVRAAWVGVRLWNKGGRAFTVERIGFQWLASWQEGSSLHLDMTPTIAEIALDGEKIELAPNGPSQTVSTPLGSAFAAGLDPFSDLIVAWAHTTDGTEWTGPMHPVVLTAAPPPPGMTFDQLRDQLNLLRQQAGDIDQLSSRFLVFGREEPDLEA
jgi:hypothetical protein